MSRTITALFDTQADAEAGRQRLLDDAKLHIDNARIHDKSSIGATGYSSAAQPGMWASIKNAFLPDEDRHIYEEGVRRGGYLLTADVEEHEADEAVRALEHANFKSVDIDERAKQWKLAGWTPPVIGAMVSAGGTAGDGVIRAMGTTGDEAHFDVVKEELVVGKREVERGGVRVRSYVTETPVHEQISLREEKIRVERHPVDQAVGDDAFREQSIELTATGEEAVVAKTARVVGEVVINKTVDQRVEKINDTVRHTDVIVEKLDGTQSSQSSGQGEPGIRKI